MNPVDEAADVRISVKDLTKFYNRGGAATTARCDKRQLDGTSNDQRNHTEKNSHEEKNEISSNYSPRRRHPYCIYHDDLALVVPPKYHYYYYYYSPKPRAPITKLRLTSYADLLSANFRPPGKELIDTKMSFKRYSLFGANVTPEWEFYTDIQGVKAIPIDTPDWKVPLIQQRNRQCVLMYVRWREIEIRRRELERLEKERITCVPEWMSNIIKEKRKKRIQENTAGGYGDQAEQMKDLLPWQQEVLARRLGRMKFK